MAYTLRYSAVSDIGRSRKKNDDSGYAGEHLVMVADGMGGAAAGDLASAVTVETMRRLDAPVVDDMLQALAGAVHRSNDRLAELIEEDPSVEGMGTTVTAVLFDGGRIAVAHLGDSRGYLWHDGELLRVTNDHTWVQSLIDEGRITEAEAKVHSHRSLLLKVLDGRHDNDPDLAVYDVEAGDRVLICSDGLSGFVDHERIQRVLSVGTAESVAQELLQLALESGSNDNVTVVVADIVDEPAPDGLTPVVVGAAAEHPHGPLSRLRSWATRDDLAPSKSLMDPDVDPEELRYAPREPRRFRWVFRGVVTLVLLGLLAIAANLSYNWSQRQYYVAAYEGRVAIYRGVQADLPGVTLHHMYETEGLLLSQLPSFRRSQVLDGLQADDLDHARSIVDQLKTFAAACASESSAAARSSTGPSNGKAGHRSTSTAGPTRGTRHTGSVSHPHRRASSSAPAGSAASTGAAQTTAPTTAGSDSDVPQECAGATPIPGSTS
jgi:serine/threonine protein phosphatase PrpC